MDGIELAIGNVISVRLPNRSVATGSIYGYMDQPDGKTVVDYESTDGQLGWCYAHEIIHDTAMEH